MCIHRPPDVTQSQSSLGFSSFSKERTNRKSTTTAEIKWLLTIRIFMTFDGWNGFGTAMSRDKQNRQTEENHEKTKKLHDEDRIQMMNEWSTLFSLFIYTSTRMISPVCLSARRFAFSSLGNRWMVCSSVLRSLLGTFKHREQKAIVLLLPSCLVEILSFSPRIFVKCGKNNSTFTNERNKIVGNESICFSRWRPGSNVVDERKLFKSS